ncbi:MAG: radical SAM protein [Candidatus Omnitrophica bacterium]|nr:radical SAM protein [Candidatus Omnitrophota bacterium]
METSAQEIKLPVLGTNGYPLQEAAVYGPIHSRRFGHSLGINPLPVTYKFCDFDCVYCQYGWTPRALNPTDSKPAESSARSGMRAPRTLTPLPGNSAKKTDEKLKPLGVLLDEITASFRKMKRDQIPVDVITIAGNGEPTLYPEFPDLVKGLIELRDDYYPKAPLGILSDSSQCHRPQIKEALERLDERCMKLDAGDSETIEKINRPAGGFDLKRTLEALKNLKDVTLQSLFVQGSFDNTRPDQIERWIEAVRYTKPASVQVYTIDRPPADSNITAVSQMKLEEIAGLCRSRTNIRTEVFD